MVPQLDYNNNEAIPNVSEGFWPQSMLQPTTSLFYEHSRVWIDELKFARNPKLRIKSHFYYKV